MQEKLRQSIKMYQNEKEVAFVVRCLSPDFESPAPQASNVVAKERKAFVGNRPPPEVWGCHPVAQSQGW
jgi:hypothetical protein